MFVQGENRVFDQVTAGCKEHATIQSSKKTETELVFLLLPKTKSGVVDFVETSAGHDQKPLKIQELKKMRSMEEASKTISRDKLESTDRKK